MRWLLAVFAFVALAGPVAAQQRLPAPDVDVPQLMMPGPLGDKALGDPNAPVTVIEYASLTCPHCGRVHSDTYPTLKSQYIDTGKVRFILREFPLDTLGFAAFMVARCSGDHFFDVVDTLYDHQADWAYVQNPVDALIKLTAPFGIGDQAAFQTCVNNQDIFNHVDQVAERGADMFGVSGTPTFFFNGYRVVGEITVDDLNRIYGIVTGATAAPSAPAAKPDFSGAYTPL